jgi:hypothetical protein
VDCQAFFEAQPGFAQRFPGGIVQFAQMAGELPEEALEDIMIAEAMGNEDQDRDMPGAMPGDIFMFAEDIDDPNAPVEGHGPMPVQNDEGARQVPRDTDSSEDEDEESSDEEEIAVSCSTVS